MFSLFLLSLAFSFLSLFQFLINNSFLADPVQAKCPQSMTADPPYYKSTHTLPNTMHTHLNKSAAVTKPKRGTAGVCWQSSIPFCFTVEKYSPFKTKLPATPYPHLSCDMPAQCIDHSKSDTGDIEGRQWYTSSNNNTSTCSSSHINNRSPVTQVLHSEDGPATK